MVRMSSGPPRRLTGIRAADAAPLEVTAHLQQGAALPTWFPAPLDGILAAAARRQRLGRGYGTVEDHHREDLPLCMIRRDGHLGRSRRGDVWAATCAVPSDAIQDVHWWHGRSLDIQGAARVARTVPANAEVGRWKAVRIPLIVTATRTLTWRAIGDPDGVRALLDQIQSVGKKRGQGEGVVTAWDVRVDGDSLDLDRICWQDDRHIARPFPARYAGLLGVDDYDLVPHAVRPPYWRPPERSSSRGFERCWPATIAPWTVRP
jgi:hypothetical protein